MIMGLKGFDVFRNLPEGGDKLTAADISDDGIWERWHYESGIKPDAEGLKLAITDDGKLLLVDLSGMKMGVIPAEGRYLIMYGDGKLEEY